MKFTQSWAADCDVNKRCLSFLLANNTVIFFFAANVLNVNITQACGREAECIQVYKTVEQTHPNKAVKKQAAELRYIMEAPKLQLSPEEKISLPLLENLDRYKYACKAFHTCPKFWHLHFVSCTRLHCSHCHDDHFLLQLSWPTKPCHAQV